MQKNELSSVTITLSVPSLFRGLRTLQKLFCKTSHRQPKKAQKIKKQERRTYHTTETYQNLMKQSVEIRGGGTIFFSFPSTNKICHFRFLINSWQQSVQNIHWPNVWRKFVQIGCRNVKSHYAHSILCYPILTMNLQPL